MDEMHAELDRLEARIDHQAGRIDALYEKLEERGVLPRHSADSEAEVEAPDSRSVWKQKSKPARRQPTRLHVGEATGV